MSTGPITIFLCNDTAAQFTETEVTATNVGELRSELNLSSEAINVNREVVEDDHGLRDGDRVAAVKTNKKGGKEVIVFTLQLKQT